MRSRRRTVLSVVGSILAVGCLGGGVDAPGGTGSPPPRTATGSETAVGTPDRCDPADVTRPRVPTGTNIEGRAYPRKPTSLTVQSVAEYLSDFETAFAWNRILQTEGVTSLNIDTLDGFIPDETGDGFLASSGMRLTYSADTAGGSEEREYVANYFVSPGPVYRVESRTESVAPRESEETQLVQCGADPE